VHGIVPQDQGAVVVLHPDGHEPKYGDRRGVLSRVVLFAILSAGDAAAGPSLPCSSSSVIYVSLTFRYSFHLGETVYCLWSCHENAQNKKGQRP
jgi:hypothetical protein